MKKPSKALEATTRVSGWILDMYRVIAQEEGRTLSKQIDIVLRAELERRRRKP